MSLFFSASPTLRQVQWRVLMWSRQWPPCWAWWWRGWSRALMGAAALSPMAAPSPAMKCRRFLSGGDVPVDGATSYHFVFRIISQLTHLAKCDPHFRVLKLLAQNNIVTNVWMCIVVFAVCNVIYSPVPCYARRVKRLYITNQNRCCEKLDVLKTPTDCNSVLHRWVILEKNIVFIRHTWMKEYAGT